MFSLGYWLRVTIVFSASQMEYEIVWLRVIRENMPHDSYPIHDDTIGIVKNVSL